MYVSSMGFDHRSSFIERRGTDTKEAKKSGMPSKMFIAPFHVEYQWF